jgi:predicted RecB family nuclease
MKKLHGEIRLSATDVSNHLACRHLTELDLSVQRGEREAPKFEMPDVEVIRQLGERHEAKYLKLVEADVTTFLNLKEMNESQAIEETLRAMAAGVDAIAQGALIHGRWFGRPDVLRKVSGRPSRFGSWSYEVYDCKLAKETKATTILQLSFYSELLGEIQSPRDAHESAAPATDPKSKIGKAQAAFDFDDAQISPVDYLPQFMWVVPPGKETAPEKHRVAEYSAYYRHVKARLEKATDNGNCNTYPEPCQHCDVCRWFKECRERRVADNHLSLVAGIRRQQRDQLEIWNISTVKQLAVMPIPLLRDKKPLHGSRESIERVREQARVQVESDDKKQLVYEPILPIVEKTGFCKLPEPSKGDVFVDLEGDAFVGNSGLQYLFGVATKEADGQLNYQKRWAENAAEEKSSFEWFVDLVMARRKEFPDMHVYHFGGYEPGTFKRLMGLYATREEEIDSMLRAGLFIDLHSIFKQALRAGVEEYSLKQLEHFCGFQRTVDKDDSRAAMRYIEHRLELAWEEPVPEKHVVNMEAYNRDDCFATSALRDWLEARRTERIAAGDKIDRPQLGDPSPPEDLHEWQLRVAALVGALTSDVPPALKDRNSDQRARWLMAQLIDWHWREEKPAVWEFYRLAEKTDEDLFDERQAISGLTFDRVVQPGDKPIVRYTFPRQEISARKGKDLWHREERVGIVAAFDDVNRTIDIEQIADWRDRRPTSVFVRDPYRSSKAQRESLYRLGCWIRDNGVDSPGLYRAGRDLLLRNPPRFSAADVNLKAFVSGGFETGASELAGLLNNSVLAIQGPPGSGKTTLGAEIIHSLVRAGKRVGVSALSHEVIHQLLKKVKESPDGSAVRCVHKCDDGKFKNDGITTTKNNEATLKKLQKAEVEALGGTAFMWSRPDFANSVDVLIVDEAGQMSLADVLAIAPAASSLILIGDPQQLSRPQKGSHPDGAERSALEHLLHDPDLGQLKTIPPNLGLFMPETKRLHPAICAFTSEIFYEGNLKPLGFTRNRVVAGHPWLDGAGLWFVPLNHSGNSNSSKEEVEAIARIVDSLSQPEVRWFRGAGNEKSFDTATDILIVAPYNAQVADLSERLPGLCVGTVDKFQGKEAPVVIYSLTTSTPEDAPRGMEFLYSLNRFNVATSRAQTAVIVVGNPHLFEPECKSPRQMQLANAFCAYLERAQIKEMI